MQCMLTVYGWVRSNQSLFYLSQVLGKVPNIILEGAKAADEDLKASTTTSTRSSGSVETVPFNATFATSASASFPSGSSGGGGRSGEVSFERKPCSSGPSDTTIGGVSEPPAPPIKIDDETLVAVSRAIMGRLDIVDLVGKTTAYEAAERVRDALLDPLTVERLKAVRRYVDSVDAEFPPEPLESEVSGPIYGRVRYSHHCLSRMKHMLNQAIV